MRFIIVLFVVTSCVAKIQADDTTRANPPVEKLPTDSKLAKVILIAGSNAFKPGEHEYVGGCAVLMDLLAQNPGVAPVLAIDWPQKDETWNGVKAVVFFFDGGDKHTVLKGDRAARIQKLADSGVGLVQFHKAVDYPKDFGDRARGWAGAAWEKSVSERAHWVHEFNSFPDHPICRGVSKFKIDDGWLWKLKFVPEGKGVTPLVRTWSPKATAKPTGLQDVVGWAYERPAGGRSFSFTGGHLHASFAQEGYRRFLVNGINWSAGMEVPKEGAKVELDEKLLPTYLKDKAAKK
jgi:type 1 glutamine amidotransferase